MNDYSPYYLFVTIVSIFCAKDIQDMDEVHEGDSRTFILREFHASFNVLLR